MVEIVFLRGYSISIMNLVFCVKRRRNMVCPKIASVSFFFCKVDCFEVNYVVLGILLQ